jgi:hypothetical protein
MLLEFAAVQRGLRRIAGTASSPADVSNQTLSVFN